MIYFLLLLRGISFSTIFPHQPQSSVPPDKLVQQLIMQAFQAFYIQDYETGIHFLEQIRSNLPRYMYQLSPAYRTLCKDIVKMLQDGSLVPDKTTASVGQQAALSHPGLVGLEETPSEETSPNYESHPSRATSSSQLDFAESSTEAAEPTTESVETTQQPAEDQVFSGDSMSADFQSELSTAVNAVKGKKKKKVQEKLTGSMDELEDFDF